MLAHPPGTDLLPNTLGDFEPGPKNPVRASHDLTTGTSAERAVSLLSLASTPIAVTTGCERQVRVEFQLGATAVPFRLSLQPRAPGISPRGTPSGIPADIKDGDVGRSLPESPPINHPLIK
jgi:hypothetical protein